MVRLDRLAILLLNIFHILTNIFFQGKDYKLMQLQNVQLKQKLE